MTYQACMQKRVTLHQSAAACGISYRTALLWRHRFLANARTLTVLEGIVEMDETYFRESCKGSRSLRQRRKARKRGGGRGVSCGRSPAHRPALQAVALKAPRTHSRCPTPRQRAPPTERRDLGGQGRRDRQ